MIVKVNKKDDLLLDFSNGQIVESFSTDQIVLVTGKSTSEDTFSGICLFGSNINSIGEVSNSWAKDCFELFKGKIEISNS